MSRSTISLYKLSEMLPDAETARQYLESHRWPDGPACPFCKGNDRITVRKNGYYRCNYGYGDFTVRTKTIFERSHVPLHKWLHAMYRILTARKGISSMQLAKEIGVTQKTAPNPRSLRERSNRPPGGSITAGSVRKAECRQHLGLKRPGLRFRGGYEYPYSTCDCFAVVPCRSSVVFRIAKPT
jgi:transposase-like protein